MNEFFESTIHPLLEVTRLRTLIEVGAEEGLHTRKLLPYLFSRGAHLHVIDPVPRFGMENGPYATLTKG